MNLKKLARLQERLASRVSLAWDGRKVTLVGGADFSMDSQKGLLGACIVVMKIPELEVVEVAQAKRKVKFPYIPGYLSFREGPAFFKCFRRIKVEPDVMFVDGNGIAHPRKIGLASHVGVVLNIVTIGCAKTPFFPFNPPPEQRGAFTFFQNRDKENVGICLRTRSGVKPVFISPGHRIDFTASLELALCCSKYRIPEPLRAAHNLSKRIFSR